MTDCGDSYPSDLGQGVFEGVDGPARAQVPFTVEDQDRDLELLALRDQLVLAPGALELAPDLRVTVLVDAEPRGRHLLGVLARPAVLEIRRPLEDGGLAFVALGLQLLEVVADGGQPGGYGLLERLVPGLAEPGAAGVDQGADPVLVIERVPQRQRRSPGVTEQGGLPFGGLAEHRV